MILFLIDKLFINVNILAASTAASKDIPGVSLLWCAGFWRMCYDPRQVQPYSRGRDYINFRILFIQMKPTLLFKQQQV